MSVGLNSNFIVKFGKTQTIQSDENGEILVTVKRGEKRTAPGRKANLLPRAKEASGC